VYLTQLLHLGHCPKVNLSPRAADSAADILFHKRMPNTEVRVRA
jgi:hypothetical protein